MCADGCAGCSAECAACAAGCAGCAGCDSGRGGGAPAAFGARAALAAIRLATIAELAFNPHQPRDARGRWIKAVSAPDVDINLPRPSEGGGAGAGGRAVRKAAKETPSAPKAPRAPKAPKADITEVSTPTAPEAKTVRPVPADGYVPAHIKEVQDYLDGTRRPALPLTYLYGGVSKESYQSHFTPQDRARILGELKDIRSGMKEDARDRPMVDRTIKDLEEIRQDELHPPRQKATEEIAAQAERDSEIRRLESEQRTVANRLGRNESAWPPKVQENAKKRRARIAKLKEVNAEITRLDELEQNARVMFGTDEARWPKKAQQDLAKIRAKRDKLIKSAKPKG